MLTKARYNGKPDLKYLGELKFPGLGTEKHLATLEIQLDYKTIFFFR
jgi:hypothetical protein